MTRLVLYVAYLLVAAAAGWGVFRAWLAEDWRWLVVWLLAGAFACLAVNAVNQGARIERVEGVTGAWRRRDPDAWRHDVDDQEENDRG